MPEVKRARDKATARADGQVAFNLRLPREMLVALDKWQAELNSKRTFPQLTRSDLVRGVLEWATRTRPKWEGK